VVICIVVIIILSIVIFGLICIINYDKHRKFNQLESYELNN